MQMRPAMFGADPVAHPLIVRPKLFARLFIALGDISRRVNTDGSHRLAEMLIGAAIEVDVRPESARLAADNGEHQRHVVSGRAHDGFRAAADPDPGHKM